MKMLKELEPKEKNLVIDLVRQAGLDVSDWSNYSGAPGANPKYCYEWAFVNEAVAVVLNLWHEQCKIKGKNITYPINFRADAKLYASRGKHRWAARAKRADEAIKAALRLKLPIRVILLGGKRRDRNDPNAGPSKVEKRELDPEFWHISAYNDNSGALELCRGPGISGFEDQFTTAPEGQEAAKRREVIGSAFNRDPKVREWVLYRSKGRCEFCGEEGFKTGNNSIYLETHHVVPLSEGGPDTVGNVIALCPNHHRQAHHGFNRESLREQFLEMLIKAD